MIIPGQAQALFPATGPSVYRTSLLHGLSGLGDSNLPATGLEQGSSKNPFASKVAGKGVIYKNGKPDIATSNSDPNIFQTQDGTTLHWGDEQPGYLYAKADWYETTYQQFLDMVNRNAGDTQAIAYNLDNALAYNPENLFPAAEVLGMTPEDAATYIFKNSGAYSKAQIADLLSKAALAQASVTAMQASVKNMFSNARQHDQQAVDIENSLLEQAKSIFKAQPNTFAITSVISTVDQSTLDALNQVAGLQMVSYYANDSTLTASTQNALDKTATAAISIATNSDTAAADVNAAKTAITDTLSNVDVNEIKNTLDNIGFTPVTVTTKKVDGSTNISITGDANNSIALTNQIATLTNAISDLEKQAIADKAAATAAAAAAAKAQADALAKAAADAQAAIKTAADKAAADAEAAIKREQAFFAAQAAAKAKADADAAAAKNNSVNASKLPTLLWIAGAAFILGKL
jgi:hypothetical protein